MTAPSGIRSGAAGGRPEPPNTRPVDLTTLAVRQAGAIWGHLVGNAAGVPYASAAIEQLDRIRFGAVDARGQTAGIWSDDGALMLALLNSLLSVGFDPEDQAKRIHAWYSDGIYTPNHGGRLDAEVSTRDAIHAFERGTPAELCGPTDERTSGTSALARLLPIALAEWNAPDDVLVAHARRASRVTDGTTDAQVASAFYVLLVRGLLGGDGDRARVRRDVLTRLQSSAEAQSDRAAILPVVRALEERSGRHGTDGAIDTLWSAWDAFAGAPSYWDAIERAIRSGGRTAATAALAGGLAGAYWGLTGIPNACLVGMRGHGIAGPLIARLMSPNSARVPTAPPIRVEWVDLTSVPVLRDAPGRLGLTSLPGQQPDGRSAVHWRDLEADAERLRSVDSVDTMVMLALDHELLPVRRPGFVDVVSRNGIEVLESTMPDMDVPPDRAAFSATLDLVRERLRAGRSVAVACRGGRGRAGTVLGCLLRDAGLDADAAIAMTRQTDRSVIESPFQEAFVRGWDPRHGAMSSRP